MKKLKKTKTNKFRIYKKCNNLHKQSKYLQTKSKRPKKKKKKNLKFPSIKMNLLKNKTNFKNKLLK